MWEQCNGQLNSAAEIMGCVQFLLCMAAWVKRPPSKSGDKHSWTDVTCLGDVEASQVAASLCRIMTWNTKEVDSTTNAILVAKNVYTWQYHTSIWCSLYRRTNMRCGQYLIVCRWRAAVSADTIVVQHNDGNPSILSLSFSEHLCICFSEH